MRGLLSHEVKGRVSLKKEKRRPEDGMANGLRLIRDPRAWMSHTQSFDNRRHVALVKYKQCIASHRPSRPLYKTRMRHRLFTHSSHIVSDFVLSLPDIRFHSLFFSFISCAPLSLLEWGSEPSFSPKIALVLLLLVAIAVYWVSNSLNDRMTVDFKFHESLASSVSQISNFILPEPSTPRVLTVSSITRSISADNIIRWNGGSCKSLLFLPAACIPFISIANIDY